MTSVSLISPKIIVTLWKPYRTEEDLSKVFDEWSKDATISPKNRYIALPYQYLISIAPKYATSGFVFGSDFMDPVSTSSFTASVATELLKKANAKFVLLGTHEHRTRLGETNASIKEKIQKVGEEKLIPFLCLGETVEEFTQNKSREAIGIQLKESLEGLPPERLRGLTLVYEAPWMDKYPFKPNGEELSKAYKEFNAAVTEFFDPTIFSTLHFIYAYPFDMDEIPEDIKKMESSGFYLEKPIYYTDLELLNLHKDLRPGLSEEHTTITSPALIQPISTKVSELEQQSDSDSKTEKELDPPVEFESPLVGEEKPDPNKKENSKEDISKEPDVMQLELQESKEDPEESILDPADIDTSTKAVTEDEVDKLLEKDLTNVATEGSKMESSSTSSEPEVTFPKSKKAKNSETKSLAISTQSESVLEEEDNEKIIEKQKIPKNLKSMPRESQSEKKEFLIKNISGITNPKIAEARKKRSEIEQTDKKIEE